MPVQEVTGQGGGGGWGIVDGPRLPWVPEVQVPAAGRAEDGVEDVDESIRVCL